VAIARNASVDTAARQIVAAALEQMQANAPRVATGSDEYLHQFRVGLRRLRGCVRLLRDLFDEKTAAAIRADSRWLSRLTGNARDWDVFVAETLPALAATLEVRESANEARAAARARLRVALESSRHAAFNLRFARWLARPAQASSGTMRADAMAALERQHHKALRAVQGLAGLSPAQRHRVRIRLKRLRYACDALASLFPRAAADGYLKALAAIQKDLGGAMDARVAMGLVKSIEADDAWKKEARARLKAAEARSLQHVDRHVASLQRARPFWKGTR
jgi:CHAD domain-containing protein